MNQISVITICFNNLEDVITTCQSVDMQIQKPFEHLIINGSTTPDIKNYLENNRNPFIAAGSMKRIMEFRMPLIRVC